MNYYKYQQQYKLKMGSINFKDPKFYKQQTKHFTNQLSANHLPPNNQIITSQRIQEYSLTTKRNKIDPKGMFPLSAIGYLQIHHPNQKTILEGTCIIINQNVLLTCAHNLYSFEQKIYYKSIDLYANAHGPFKNNKVTIVLQNNVKIHQNFIKYKTKEHQSYDYGVVFLKQTLGKQFGTIKIGNYKVQINDEIFIFGYPTLDNNIKNQIYLYGSKGNIKELDDYVLHYDIQTQSGQSGSPLFVYEQQQWKLIGIHTISDPSGVLLNSEAIDSINKWITIKESTLQIQDIKSLGKDTLSIQKMFDKHNWQTLTSLSFVKCNLMSKDIKALNRIRWNIRFLNLSNNRIDAISLQPAKFKAVQTLLLDNNMITSLPKEINSFLSLKKLSLVNNRIQTVSIQIDNNHLEIILTGNKLNKENVSGKNFIF